MTSAPSESVYPPPLTVTSDELIKLFEQRTNEGLFELTDIEKWWRDRCELFEQHGYLLRPRFRPGWKPSWLGTNMHPLGCEDSFNLGPPQVIDATRLKDGKRVAIKNVVASSQEVSLARSLSSDEYADQDNPCVPILDYFEDREEFRSGRGFLVMPLLVPFNEPDFIYVEEVVEFIRQTIHGIVYLHKKNVAHRDLADRNIMMDAERLYPLSFHPAMQWKNPVGTGPSYPLARRDCPGGVQYYFIDFGLSSKFEDGEPRSVVGGDALDQDVPELSDRIPYDPFPVDIFTLGNIFHGHFVLKYRNMAFLEPLVESMKSRKPSNRPSAEAVLQRFENEILPQLKWYHLRKPLIPKETRTVFVAFADVKFYSSETWSYARKLLKKFIPRWKITDRPQALPQNSASE